MTLRIVQTQTDAALAASQDRHAQDAVRSGLIASARRFKSSWIELAEALSACRENRQFELWGFVNFEEYCRKELHLRQATVDKLVGSYAFLHRAAPEVLRRDGIHERVPTYQSVDFLRRAEEEQDGEPRDPETMEKLRQAVLEESQPLPKISRIFRPTLFPQETSPAANFSEVASSAKKLLSLLEQSSLPDALLQKARPILLELAAAEKHTPTEKTA